MPKIVHISYTPLAGSPLRIVNALNRHTDCDARLVTLDCNAYGERVFENDLDWHESREESIQVIESADILHFHHFFDLKNNHFSIDFNGIASKAKFVRQFHSVPLTMARGDRGLASEIVNSDIPQLVVAQHQERYFPNAKIVPNIIPQDAPEYMPLAEKPEQLKVCYAPSVINSCWDDNYDYTRWDTKGSVETVAMVNEALRLSKAGSIELISNTPHAECLQLKRQCHIGIDELVTGSFHLSSLEFLSLGIPTLAYLDNRTVETLKSLTGADHLPWVNVMLENSKEVLMDLLGNRSLRDEVGLISRKWVEEFYREEKMIHYYAKSYEDLLNFGVVIQQPRYNIESPGQKWLICGKYDSEWKDRIKKNRVRKIFGVFKARHN